MVLQSEFSDEFSNILSNQVFEAEMGESTGVDYYDNALDTINLDNQPIFVLKSNGTIELTSEINTLTGVGSDFNSVLYKINGKALNKIKHTLIENKKNTEKIIYKIRLEFVPEMI